MRFSQTETVEGLSSAVKDEAGRGAASSSGGRSGRVFLLGAGFSRAVNPAMPVMQHLLVSLQEAAAVEQWPTASQFGLNRAVDLEAWLDSLVVAQPYRSDSENLEAAGLFRRASGWIGRHLTHVQEKVCESALPPKLVHLVAHWQDTKCTVISMNYDTRIERCVVQDRALLGLTDFADRAVNAVRAVPLPIAGGGDVGGPIRRETLLDAFCFAKLHGSVDWQYPGGTGRGLAMFATGYDVSEETPHEMLRQMQRYIIPPSFAKGPMFDHEIIRENWHVARRGLKRSRELTVMGYSLPPADTAVVQMLREYAPNKIVLLDKNRELKDHYETLLEATVEIPEYEDPIWEWAASVTQQA